MEEVEGTKIACRQRPFSARRAGLGSALLFLVLLTIPALPSSGWGAPATLSLAGDWQIRLDAEDQGLVENWANKPLDSQDLIRLPNTTDLAGYGFVLDTNAMRYPVPFPTTSRFPGVAEPSRSDEHGYLVRRRLFVGPAWYEREIEIPSGWIGKAVVFKVERAMWKTDVWLDGKHLGACDSLVAEHRFELGKVTPGQHRLTVRVDNRMIHNIATIAHAYGPETQTRWNGLLGEITLEATDQLAITSIRVFPAGDRKSARVNLGVLNSRGASADVTVRLAMTDETGRALTKAESQIVCTNNETEHELVLEWPTPADAWSEFTPRLYDVTASLESEGIRSPEERVRFGFRRIERQGKELHLNGRPLFLRGTLDCCVYPNTGHPPMSTEDWRRTFTIVKNHGFNHVRFHTWCPPRAAFEAADELGLYLQPEAPAWIDDWVLNTVTKPQGLGRDAEVWDYLKRENRRILQAYGNHPSFLMFTIGNEFGMTATDWEAVNAEVASLKASDPRRLYSGCTARKLMQEDDFWTTHQTGASTRGVGPAHTDWDFARAVETSPVPVISHETGQRPVFPDYPQLLPKFRGPLLPLNLVRFQRALTSSGMADRADDFVRASALFQLVQYKAEHEAMLRTPSLGGYQLLMLNDFTGQSEALVGVLDPFWESKGIVSPKDVLQWNSPIVPLARFAKYVWKQDEVFTARLEVAHYGERELDDSQLEWSLNTAAGHVLAAGESKPLHAGPGSLVSVETIHVPLTNVSTPAALALTARLGLSENSWRIWVYPSAKTTPVPADLVVVTSWNETVSKALAEGKRVLFLAHGLTNAHATRTGFESVYWSAGWWGNRFSTLGIVCDSNHPALALFPNAGHSDWQWRELCSGATTLHLAQAPAGVQPIIQGVPDFHFNSLLSHLFEVQVGNGRLAVCGYDLENQLESRPAARQFRESLFRYLSGPNFNPKTRVSENWVADLLSSAKQP